MITDTKINESLSWFFFVSGTRITFRLSIRAWPPTHKHKRTHTSTCSRYCVAAHRAAVTEARASTVIPADLHRIQRNVRVGVGPFCPLFRSHRRALSPSRRPPRTFSTTQLTSFLHAAPLFCSALLVVSPLYGFCLAGSFADRLQLGVVAWMEARSWVSRLAFRVPLYGRSLHTTPTHLSQTTRRDSKLDKGHFLVRCIHLLNAWWWGINISCPLSYF